VLVYTVQCPLHYSEIVFVQNNQVEHGQPVFLIQLKTEVCCCHYSLCL